MSLTQSLPIPLTAAPAESPVHPGIWRAAWGRLSCAFAPAGKRPKVMDLSELNAHHLRDIGLPPDLSVDAATHGFGGLIWRL